MTVVVCCRQLLAAGLRVLLCSQSRILHHTHLRAVMSHSRSVVDLVLAASRCVAGARLTGHHDRSHDDHHSVQLQRIAAQDLLPQEYRHFSGHLLHHGVRVAARVCMRQLPRTCEADDDDDRHESPASAAVSASSLSGAATATNT